MSGVERSFQKQPQICLATRKGDAREVYTKSFGLRREGDSEIRADEPFIDKKCPMTGTVSLRGRVLRGVVISTKMRRTIVVRRDYLQWVRKYRRFEKRNTKIPAHISPYIKVKEGDIVSICECRPLSKTVHFNVFEVKQTAEGSDKKQFRAF